MTIYDCALGSERQAISLSTNFVTFSPPCRTDLWYPKLNQVTWKNTFQVGPFLCFGIMPTAYCDSDRPNEGWRFPSDRQRLPRVYRPRYGIFLSCIFRHYFDVIYIQLEGLTLWQHPSFFGYFPAACTFEGILGDLYSSSVTNPGFNVDPLLLLSIHILTPC